MAEQFIRITDKTGQPLAEKPLDLSEVRATLADTRGQGYWRSLEELTQRPGFEEMLRREFPGQAPKDWAPLPRREFVRLMGAGLALAGLSGCAFQPPEKIVPYVNQPEQIVPGIPLFYATAMSFMGYGLGLLAESHEGRPTKLEGNPDHPSTGGSDPASRGRAGAIHQAAILNLYDPDRLQAARHGSDTVGAKDVSAAITNALRASGNGSANGDGVGILTETITSPLLLSQLAAIQKQYPKLKWYSYEAISRDNNRAGVRSAFGQDLEAVYDYSQAERILSLDCDFLLEEPGFVAHAAEYASKRRVTDKIDAAGKPVGEINRLYVVESTVTITGANADHRFPVKAAEVDGIARAIAARIGVPGVTAPANVPAWVNVVADDLKASAAGSVVCAGSHQPAVVHALAHAINSVLGSKSVTYVEPIAVLPTRNGKPQSNADSLKELVDDLKNVRLNALVILSANPVFNAPPDLGFAAALELLSKRTDGVTVYLGSHDNETAARCAYVVPEAHFLEYWGDVRSATGELALIQPLVKPLYEAAKAPSEILALFTGRPNTTSYNLLLDFHARQHFSGRSFNDAVSAYEQLNDADRLAFDRYFQTGVHDGYLPGYKAVAKPVSLVGGFGAALPAPAAAPGGLEVNFRPDPTIWDGRFANNGWLQELPKPVSKTVWDNAIFVAPQTAEANGWYANQEVTLTVGKKSVKGAFFLLPGQPADTLTVNLGYGRQVVGRVGSGTGFNGSLIQDSNNLGFASGVKVESTGGVYKIATTAHYNIIAPLGKETGWGRALNPFKQGGASQTKVVDNILEPVTRELDIDGTHGRDLIRQSTWDDFKAGKELPTSPHGKKGLPITYPENPREYREVTEKDEAEEAPHKSPNGPTWGMPTSERNLEGQPSFYPRNTDKQALTPYKDDSLNKGVEVYAWGMTIDLQTCIGCNACVTACQSENNISIVGKDQVLMNRSMHWIRIDGYFRGSYENPELHFEPMACQHCEKAPCAPVCPFNAVMESVDGINEQIYNRCVGTKYCENNCPYKVRRFNFLQYSDQITPVIQLMNNPDVTVRSRGVMEKCTYCIQRVNYAKFQAEKENRRVRDGEIVTACAQSCPTNAIVFGNINDPNSAVSKLKRSDLTYGLLLEANTMPRTSYLAKFKNPNPALKDYMPAFLIGEHASEKPEGQTYVGEEDATRVGSGKPKE